VFDHVEGGARDVGAAGDAGGEARGLGDAREELEARRLAHGDGVEARVRAHARDAGAQGGQVALANGGVAVADVHDGVVALRVEGALRGVDHGAKVRRAAPRVAREEVDAGEPRYRDRRGAVEQGAVAELAVGVVAPAAHGAAHESRAREATAHGEFDRVGDARHRDGREARGGGAVAELAVEVEAPAAHRAVGHERALSVEARAHRHGAARDHHGEVGAVGRAAVGAAHRARRREHAGHGG
jgi:hypothetical protein